jgi:hypothetical protein
MTASPLTQKRPNPVRRIVDIETVDRNSEASVNQDSHNASEDEDEQDDDTSFAGDNITNNLTPPNINQEEVNEEVHAPAANLSTILDCIQKCRDEISWLKDNPNFHTRRENETFTQDIRRTIKRLYSQLADNNSNYNLST